MAVSFAYIFSAIETEILGRCLLLLVRTRSAHHASNGLSPTPSNTRLKLKQDFPTVTKSGLMFKPGTLNSSISLTTNC